VHNFADAPRRIAFKVGEKGDELLVPLFGSKESRVHNDGTHRISLGGYGWQWFRVGGIDSVLSRSTLSLADDKVT
jgi:maltose alpha-D-glucosyltransferase/alpha-amylase